MSTPEALASPDLSTPWVPLWPLQTQPLGDELAYAQITAPVAVPAVAEASAVTVITAPAITVDGATPILIEFFSQQFQTAALSGGSVLLNLWEGAVNLGYLGQFVTPAPALLLVSATLRRRLTPSAGTHTYTIKASAGGNPGNIGAGPGGAAGVIAPAFVRISRVNPVPPNPSPGAVIPVTYGTTLPVSPADGQEAILVDSLSNPTYQWRFRYNAGSTSAYKWEFIGGADFIHYIATGETTAVTGSFVDFATVGPRMIVPRAGDYDIDALVGVQHAQAPALVGFSSFKGTTVQGIGRTYSIPGANYQGQIPQIAERWLALAAGDELRLRYVNYTAGTATFGTRVLRVRPVRVA